MHTSRRARVDRHVRLAMVYERGLADDIAKLLNRIARAAATHVAAGSEEQAAKVVDAYEAGFLRLFNARLETVATASAELVIEELTGEKALPGVFETKFISLFEIAQAAVRAWIDRTVREIGAPDVLINNAGFGTKPPFDQTDWDSQHQMHRVHIMATLQLTHAVLPGMIARGSGGIINVSSVAGFFRSVGGVSYCATKAWMNAFTEGLHLELRARGSAVRVQALCPGFTYTEFHDVMGMNRAAVNRRLWLNAADVVRDSLNDIGSGRVVVVPNVMYKTLVALLRTPVVGDLMLKVANGMRE